MTGSLGAKRVNDAVVQLAEQWRERDDVTILHVTGRRDYAIIQAQAPAASRLDYRIIEFGDMATLWSLCDVAICRAGAMTIAELTALGIASILVPLPSAPGDHQTKNAQVLVDVGAARLVRDAECNAPRLARELDEIFENENTERMSIAAASLASPYAASRIAHEILRARRS
jgi:UDP-N-acetylglucosamine--N-acetylmuramyl-(pentapeptide) pyrophosphoryl-undecaprenol N-acetylglucosamine transferase